MSTRTALPALLALSVLASTVAAAVVASAVAASAQGCVLPALCLPGDISAADVGIDPSTGEVTVAFEINRVLHSRRYDAAGVPMDRWKAEIYHASTAVTVNGRNREVYEATVARNAVNITRHRNDGFKIAAWDTGYTGYAADIEAEPWSSEILVARYDQADLQLITLTRDGSLLDTWRTGYDEPAAAVDLTTERVYFVAVGPAEPGGAGGRVARYDDLGQRTAEWPVDERPVALAAGPEGNLYVATRTWAAHQGSLMVLSDLGTVRETWPLGARPVAMEVDGQGVAHVLVLCCSGRGLGLVRIGPRGERRDGWMAWMTLYLPTARLR